MRKTDKGIFKPKNLQKYIGRNINSIQYRSGWELQTFLLLDKNPAVIAWSSETIQIPYFNPTKGLKGEWTVYVPDILVVIDDGHNNRHIELIEIKPIAQTPGYRKISEKTGKALTPSKYDMLEQIKNAAKWKAALEFCSKRGWKFQVLTEKNLFGVNA